MSEFVDGHDIRRVPQQIEHPEVAGAARSRLAGSVGVRRSPLAFYAAKRVVNTLVCMDAGTYGHLNAAQLLDLAITLEDAIRGVIPDVGARAQLRTEDGVIEYHVGDYVKDEESGEFWVVQDVREVGEASTVTCVPVRTFGDSVRGLAPELGGDEQVFLLSEVFHVPEPDRARLRLAPLEAVTTGQRELTHLGLG